MKLKFYHNSSDPIVVSKSLTQIGSDVNGTLRSACSVIDPVIVIKKFTGFNPASCNYLFIDEFNRYYYINNIVCINNDLFEIHCHVDVLKTYGSGIRANSAIVSRQEKNYSLYLPDNYYKSYSNPNFEIKRFNKGFSGYHYILTVASS